MFRLCAFAFAFLTAGFVAGPTARASVINLVQGSGTTTITSLVFVTDTIISIEADQTGYLSGFGFFTGHFSYTAIATPATITLVGTGTITNTHGETLTLAATILEVGTDYPRTLDGTLTITAGTGRYAGATGVIYIHGIDEEDLTDSVTLRGTIITPKKLLGIL